MRVSLPNYSTIRIKDVPNWDKTILRSFIDNKKVQKIVKTLSDRGAKVSVKCADRKCTNAVNSISLCDENSHKVVSNIIISEDKKTFIFDKSI